MQKRCPIPAHGRPAPLVQAACGRAAETDDALATGRRVKRAAKKRCREDQQILSLFSTRATAYKRGEPEPKLVPVGPICLRLHRGISWKSGKSAAQDRFRVPLSIVFCRNSVDSRRSRKIG
jgi:hypothetical protein